MKGKNASQGNHVEQLPGITRTTLAFNDQAMLCHFQIKKGAKIPLHHHEAVQLGYVISGRARFIGENQADAFEVGPGDSYVMNANEKHGAEALEDCVLIEVFAPSRDEYKD